MHGRLPCVTRGYVWRTATPPKTVRGRPVDRSWHNSPDRAHSGLAPTRCTATELETRSRHTPHLHRAVHLQARWTDRHIDRERFRPEFGRTPGAPTAAPR